MNNITTKTTPGFCPNCGSILPLLNLVGNVTCYACKKEYPPEGRFLALYLLCSRNKFQFNIYSFW